jgi:SAM-dependent methyltransferase
MAEETTGVRKDLHEENRRAWNVATDAHNSHKQDQAAFFRAGGQTLFPEELDLLGAVAGQTLVHLQCNAGQDTLSLARRGAVVTGVDISDTAIAFARRLAADSDIPATFIRADIYDWLAETAAGPQRFDIAFSSYGALVWLSDLRTWARGIAAVLKPGGRFALVEFHPFLGILDWDWALKYSYFGAGRPQSWESGVGDYVALSGAALAPSGYLEGVQGFHNPHPSHQFQWNLAEVVTAVLDAGLVLTALREYPYANGAKLLANMRELPGHHMIPPAELPDLPLMYGLAARKPD